MSEEERRRIEERRKQAEAVDAGNAEPLSALAIAKLQREVADLLEGDETVVQGLKRLRPAPRGRISALSS